jgi:hypothetical protein
VRGFKEGMKSSESDAPPAAEQTPQQIGGQTIEGEVKKEKTS